MKADLGPWTVSTWTSTGKPEVVLVSDDFKHDVALKISGDFVDLDQKIEYASALAAHMNGLPHVEVKSKDQDEPLAIGDTVQLKSGGPLMTIRSIDGDAYVEDRTVSCFYFNARAGEFVEKRFDVRLLKRSSMLQMRTQT